MKFNRREMLSVIASSALLGCSEKSAARARRTVFGVNTYGIFLNGLHPGGGFGTDMLQVLGRLGVPFTRFAASAQWAGDWAIYDADPAHYWAGMDSLFSAAEHNGVKLVPSIFWHPVALAFHMREPVGAWANPQSRTSRFAQSYAQRFVERYGGSNAVLMFEFGNEINDYVDDVSRLKTWPKEDPTLADRKPQSGDILTSSDLRGMSQRFAQTMRKVSNKPVGMGSNVPRGYAWHMARGTREPDTRAQFIEQLRAITPPDMSVLSIHLYDALWPWPKAPRTLAGILDAFVAAADMDKRISFLGEFGVKYKGNRKIEEYQFNNLMKDVKNSGVNYAAVWNVCLLPFQKDLDIIPGGARGYQLDAIVAANK